MGFFSGRVTCCRFRVSGRPPRGFGPDELEKLSAHAVGKQRLAAADGAIVGWTAGDHVLDTRFDLEKNIVSDGLHFSMRVDTNAIPADLVRAYTQVELEGLASQNPSGHPSSRQKREARLLAKEKLEDEAKDGRFLKRKVVPIFWDAPSNELLVGTTAVTMLDRLVTLFRDTFERSFDPLTAGRQAFAAAEVTGQTRAVDDARPSVFVSGQASEVAWLPDESNRDFLGNEFLLWLWYYLENQGDTLALSDGSEVTVMLTKTLSLECPHGQFGKESISSEGPTRLPEALRAIQAGKLPRKVGAILARHEAQYELTLNAESLALSGARLPAPEGDSDRARLEERVSQIRHLLETLDLMFALFCQQRLSDDWTKELGKIKKWLTAQ